MSAAANQDWVSEMFPGDGLELPTEEQRDQADALIAEWSKRWGETPITVPRKHPDVPYEGLAKYVAGMPTNRAYLRSRLRRWWGKR